MLFQLSTTRFSVSSFESDLSTFFDALCIVPVEVEARIGYLGEKSLFSSGIPEQVYNLVGRLLDQESSLRLQPDVVETDYIYERQDEGNYRVTTMGEGESQRVVTAGMKTKRNDALLSGLQADSHYAIRVSASTEVEDDEKPETVALNWSLCRKKTRACYTNLSPVPAPGGLQAVIPWRIDLTKIETLRPMRQDAIKFDPAVTTFECELEMPPLTEDPNIPLKTKVLSMNDGISLLICALGYATRNSQGPMRWTPPSASALPSVSQAPPSSSSSVPNPVKTAESRAPLDPNRHPDFPSLHLERLTNTQHLRAAVERCLRGHAQFDSPNRFLGTMPINFARRHLEFIRNKPYWISEKTDGVRFFLFISRGVMPSVQLGGSSSSVAVASAPSAYLVDRSNTYYKIPQFAALAQFLSPTSDTLLDGELVRRYRSDSYYFLMYDVIAVDGKSVWNEAMKDRLAHITELVKRFDEYMVANPQQPLPFTLLQKEIVPKERFEAVRSKIVLQPDGETSVYGDATGSHYHLTDGLIFMPEQRYPLYTCQEMFKWKFVDRQTIDFEVTFPKPFASTSEGYFGPTTIELHIGGNSSTTVLIKTVALAPQEFERLKADINHSLRPNLVIAEMGFDNKTGLWRYHKLRPDKDKPNYISIAMDTMESIAENVTLDELSSLLR